MADESNTRFFTIDLENGVICCKRCDALCGLINSPQEAGVWADAHIRVHHHNDLFREQTDADEVSPDAANEEADMVNHPPHYSNRVPGIETIQVTRHFNFNKGNAIKYIWRSGLKGDEIEDLEKAAWYLQDEIERLKKEPKHG